MRYDRIEYMRERLSDLSDDACDAIYKAIHKGHFVDAGKILDKECFEAIDEHYRENQPKSVFGEDDEVDRRLQDEIDYEKPDAA